MATKKTITNLRGPAARIVAVSAETIPALAPAEVIMTGPDQGREFAFKVPRGLPGVNAVPTDEAVATYLSAPDTDTGLAFKTGSEGHIHRVAAIVNVKSFGAVPLDQNGGEGATAEIQAAIDFVSESGGGTVIVDDDYWIKAHDLTAPPGNFLGDYGGIALKDGVRLQMTENGVLRALTSPQNRYVIVRIYNRRNVAVAGGRIIGDLETHAGTAGEWGYGIAITSGENITIEGVHVSDCWGDGINVQRLVPTPGVIVPPKRVRISNVTSNRNRRQGMSIECASDMIVEGSTFSNTGLVHGTAPMAGIDIEPVDNVTVCERVTIRHCNFDANFGWGISVFMNGTNNVTIEDCTFNANQADSQVEIITTGQNVSVTDCMFTGSTQRCIRNQGGFSRNFSRNSFDAPVWIAQNALENVARNVVIDSNTFRVNRIAAMNGLVQINEHAKFVTISNNWFENFGARGSGVWIRTAGSGTIQTLSDIDIVGNTFINMTNAIIAGAVDRVKILDNLIDACANAAINILPRNSVISRNVIRGANLVGNAAAIFLQYGAINSVLQENHIARDPATTVAETVRGTHAIDFAFVEISNTTLRATTIVDLTRYNRLPSSRPNSYAETTPGAWAW